MSYNLNELAVIQQLAQGLAQTADRMAMMKIYSSDPSLHSNWLADKLQADFSELHSAVLGDGIGEGAESAPAADLGGQSKLNARDLAYFEQVASVLGEVQAESELQQVIDSGLKVDESISLSDAFIWAKSPQGYDYWCGVLSNEERK